MRRWNLALPTAGACCWLVGRWGRKVAVIINRRRGWRLAGWLIRDDGREETTDMARETSAGLLIKSTCRPLRNGLAFE